MLVADRRRAAAGAGVDLGELLAAGALGGPRRLRQGGAVALDRLAAAADDDVIAVAARPGSSARPGRGPAACCRAAASSGGLPGGGRGPGRSEQGEGRKRPFSTLSWASLYPPLNAPVRAERMTGNMVKASHVLDRVLVLEMVRVTEAAAVAASKLIGRGDEKAADRRRGRGDARGAQHARHRRHRRDRRGRARRGADAVHRREGRRGAGQRPRASTSRSIRSRARRSPPRPAPTPWPCSPSPSRATS